MTDHPRTDEQAAEQQIETPQAAAPQQMQPEQESARSNGTAPEVTTMPAVAPTADLAAEPALDLAATPAPSPPAEPPAAPPAVPAPPAATEPAPASTSEPTIEPATPSAGEPTIEPAPAPAGEPASEPPSASEPTTEPAPAPEPSPAAEPAAEPEAEPAAQPEAEPAAQPEAEPAAQPEAELAPPALQTEQLAAPPAAADPDLVAAVHTDPTTPAPAATTAAPTRSAEPVVVPQRPPAVRSALADPGRWGRVDADGTVYVKVGDGERAVGSWQAGDPSEGLAHYARRFDDVLTEVELIEARLATGAGDPKHALASIKQLRESLADVHAVGDLDGLAAMLDYLRARAESALGEAKAAREQARVGAIARKTALVEEAEHIANEATQWKAAGDRLRAILDEWKTIRGVDRKTDDALWKRFGKARDAFNRRRGSHFAELDRQRGAAKTRKEEIVAEAEQLVESDDWGPTAGRYKQLMNDWKAAGRAPKDVDDALWQRFRAAQDQFFSKRSAAFSERDSELVANAKRKEELLTEAERIDPATDLEAARAALLRVQDRWDVIGRVPREQLRELEARLRAVEERVRNAVDAQWRRSDPEAQARVSQFRERVEQFEAQAAKARAAGDQRRAKQAEAQAAQWREWLAAAEQSVANR